MERIKTHVVVVFAKITSWLSGFFGYYGSGGGDD
jgi:hypothetical protein